jgi:hypothetical protein
MELGVVNPTKTREQGKELEEIVDRAYRVFRRNFPTLLRRKRSKEWQKDAVRRANRFRKAYSFEHHIPNGDPTKVKIHFIGVWDTVAALGFPIHEIAGFWHNFIYPFRFDDRTLSPDVCKACQALAIDEQRRAFEPVMWDEEGEQGGPGARIEQVWFAGVHSNVGGGYTKQGMSLITLDWMMDHAEKAGLRFIRPLRMEYSYLRNANDKLYDSRSGLASLYRFQARDIAAICHENRAMPRLHSSVFDRISLLTEGYAPGNLPADFEIVDEGSDRRRSLIEMVRSGLTNEQPAVSVINVDRPPQLLPRPRWTHIREHSHTMFALAWIGSLFVLGWVGLSGGGIHKTIIANTPEVWTLGDLVRSSVGQIAIIVAFVGLVGGLTLVLSFLAVRFARQRTKQPAWDFWNALASREWWRKWKSSV